MSWAIIVIYINIAKFVLINQLEKDHSMIETHCLKKVVNFIQTITLLHSDLHSKCFVYIFDSFFPVIILNHL